MAEIIEMPRLSDTMTEGVIAKWHKKVGDLIRPGDLLAEIETDKATMEFEAPIGGALLYIGAPEGKPIPIGAPIAIIGKPDEDISALLNRGASPAPSESITSPTPAQSQPAATPPPPAEAPARVPASPALGAPPAQSQPAATPPPPAEAPARVPASPALGAPPAETRLKASPLARSMAQKAGIDLHQVHGTGEGGRIIRRDVEAYLSHAVATTPVATPAQPAAAPYQEVPLSQMRKTIARRLTASMQEAPHFYLTRAVSMEAAATWREKLNALSPQKISFNDLIIKAVATALRKHPYLNAAWMGDHIRLYQEIHIGFAVAVEEGLIVPVLRHADRKGLSEIAAETVLLAQKARERKLAPEEYTGSTFSISNLGMFGIEEFTAVINPPEAAILAVGAIQPTPVVKDGQVVVERRMRVTLSCDHRVVDGATGAAFLETFTQLLEEPARLLL
jgi:pyruvate dehydrogenase E2 component (dihydrolipoamide acetyltransferase)